jgi:hypothetical protein
MGMHSAINYTNDAGISHVQKSVEAKSQSVGFSQIH